MLAQWESFSAQQKRSEFPSQNLAPKHLKLMTSIANLADEIKKHNAAVRRNSRDRVRYRKVCAVCKEGEVFAPHELRSAMVAIHGRQQGACACGSGWRGGSVAPVVGVSPTTRTFVLPYKRFAAPCLLSRAEQYLDAIRGVTYRQSVRDGRSLIGYPPRAREASSDDGSPPHQPVVDHSLIWRFVGWLGGLTSVLDEARSMILRIDPASLCHRREGSVDPHKARSSERMSDAGNGSATLAGDPRVGGLFRLQFLPPVRHEGRVRLTYLGTP